MSSAIVCSDFNKVRVSLGRSKRSARGTSRDFRVQRSTITETEKIDGAIVTFTYNLASMLYFMTYFTHQIQINRLLA